MKSLAVPKLVPGHNATTVSMIEKKMFIVPAGYDPKKYGMFLRVERSSTHDGTGFRTVIFLKGCPLRCVWCSTPESQSTGIERGEGEAYGKLMSVEDLMAEVRKDSIFYFHSGGGMTLSGGEPLMQADFAEQLLKQAQSEGINTAVETSMSVPWKNLEQVLPFVDHIYADIKHIDADLHKKYTGIDNIEILDNVRRLDNRCDRIRFVVRIPLIPGINNDPDTLHGIGRFCANLRNMDCVQLLPYHRLGMDTYRKLGRVYPLEDLKPPSKEHMEDCCEIIRSHVGSACM